MTNCSTEYVDKLFEIVTEWCSKNGKSAPNFENKTSAEKLFIFKEFYHDLNEKDKKDLKCEIGKLRGIMTNFLQSSSLFYVPESVLSEIDPNKDKLEPILDKALDSITNEIFLDLDIDRDNLTNAEILKKCKHYYN